MERGDDFIVVDTLGPEYYNHSHLPGAVNLPLKKMDRTEKVFPNKEAEIIVYCSRTCRSSQMVASRLEQLGYHHVVVYEGGKEDWVEHGLPVDRSEA